MQRVLNIRIANVLYLWRQADGAARPRSSLLIELIQGQERAEWVQRPIINAASSLFSILVPKEAIRKNTIIEARSRKSRGALNRTDHTSQKGSASKSSNLSRPSSSPAFDEV